MEPGRRDLENARFQPAEQRLNQLVEITEVLIERRSPSTSPGHQFAHGQIAKRLRPKEMQRRFQNLGPRLLGLSRFDDWAGDIGQDRLVEFRGRHDVNYICHDVSLQLDRCVAPQELTTEKLRIALTPKNDQTTVGILWSTSTQTPSHRLLGNRDVGDGTLNVGLAYGSDKRRSHYLTFPSHLRRAAGEVAVSAAGGGRYVREPRRIWRFKVHRVFPPIHQRIIEHVCPALCAVCVGCSSLALR